MKIFRHFKSYLAIIGILGLFGGAALAMHNSDPAASASPAEYGALPESPDTDPGSTDATDESTSTSVDPQWVADAIRDLEDNLQEVRAQQDAEIRQAAQDLQLAPGAQFGPPDSFDHLEQQIQDLRSGHILTDDSGEPEDPLLYEYEDGFFGSLMAIDWRCGWVSTGVNQVNAGDDAGVAETVEILRGFTETTYADSWENFQDAIDHHIDPLLEGDLSGPEEFLRATCPPETIVD